MRVIFVGGALTLIFLSVLLFLVGERTAAGRRAGIDGERYVVSGRVSGNVEGAPWAGTVAKLGSDQVLLAPDGKFRFVVTPGSYSLGVCCSTKFQSIDQAVDVVDRDVDIELIARPLLEISGRVAVAGGVESKQGFIVAAKLRGTNVVDRVTTAQDGTFALHLKEGEWVVAVENLPEGYKTPRMMYGDVELEDGALLIRESVSPRTLQIQLR